jgi:hypothetical protein
MVSASKNRYFNFSDVNHPKLTENGPAVNRNEKERFLYVGYLIRKKKKCLFRNLNLNN